MHKGFYLICLICLICFLSSQPLVGQVSQVRIRGKVVAHIESALNGSLSSIPNIEILIVKVNDHEKVRARYVKIIYEYFSDKPSLPTEVYENGKKWKFKVSRRLDCDSVLNPDYAHLIESANRNNTGDVWIMDPPPKVKFINPREAEAVPKDKVLPCYALISLKHRRS